MTLHLGKAIGQPRARPASRRFSAHRRGLVVHTVLVAIGLPALLAASVTAFTILKVVGACYLVYLAPGRRSATARRSRSAAASRPTASAAST